MIDTYQPVTRSREGYAVARKLTPEQVRVIRSGAFGKLALAQMYGVSFSTIKRVRSRKCYRWVRRVTP